MGQTQPVGVRRGSTLRNAPREGNAKTADRLANFDRKCTDSGRASRRRTVCWRMESPRQLEMPAMRGPGEPDRVRRTFSGAQTKATRRWLLSIARIRQASLPDQQTVKLTWLASQSARPGPCRCLPGSARFLHQRPAVQRISRLQYLYHPR